MPYAIELFLDPDGAARVRQMWTMLDEAGVPSLAAGPDSHYRPHVSLSVFDTSDPVRVVEALRPHVRTAIGLPIVLADLGFFLTAEAPAFLGVVPTTHLLELHHEVHRVLEVLVDSVWPYYRPDALVPHCSLALRVTNKVRLLEVASSFQLPMRAKVAAVELVQIPGATNRARLAPA